MKDFCIITNPCKDKDYCLTKEMKSLIELKGGSCQVIREGEEIPASAEGIFVLGGDGTLIRAAGIASKKNIPLIGVNLGHLGYLCELEENTICTAIEEIMLGNYIIEERMMLSGEEGAGSSPKRSSDRKKEGTTALNDVVICRKGAMQLVELIVSVNGEYLNTYRADGIIIATPTGSTGYSMSAGGPIVDPKARMILVTPINAHNLNAKSIVLDANDHITVALKGRQPVRNESVDVNFDGEWASELLPGDYVTICAAKQKAKIIKLSRLSFLEILRRKMQGY
ncbi:MAG: NAD(+)/NADH kinase [Eubacterium sp.]|jgi:NAD+ kinase|nr:NAD(+)/NADH kinase [Eubacterium sp.]